MKNLHNKFEKYKQFNQSKINDEFVIACEDGKLDEVKYLLTSNELKIHADVHYSNIYGSGLQRACKRGQIEVVKYLLTSPELKEHGDIHSDNGLCLHWASLSGHLEVIKYILSSAELKEHVDIHSQEDKAFKWAYDHNHMEVINYFIFDMNIEKTTFIQECMSLNINENVENWFTIRELNAKLDTELNSMENDKNVTKKLKI